MPDNIKPMPMLNKQKCQQVAPLLSVTEMLCDFSPPTNWLKCLAQLIHANLGDQRLEKQNAVSAIHGALKKQLRQTKNTELEHTLRAIYGVFSQAITSLQINFQHDDNHHMQLAIKLIEGIHACAPGYENRIYLQWHALTTQHSISGWLQCMQHDIVTRVFQNLMSLVTHGNEIHLYNDISKTAAVLGYGVNIINPQDYYTGNLSNDLLEDAVNRAFEEQLTPLCVLQYIEEQIFSQFNQNYDYVGYNAGGLEQQIFEKGTQWLDQFFPSKTDLCEEEGTENGRFLEERTSRYWFITNQRADQDEDDWLENNPQFLDFNWPRIRQAIADRLITEQYINVPANLQLKQWVALDNPNELRYWITTLADDDELLDLLTSKVRLDRIELLRSYYQYVPKDHILHMNLIEQIKVISGDPTVFPQYFTEQLPKILTDANIIDWIYWLIDHLPKEQLLHILTDDPTSAPNNKLLKTLITRSRQTNLKDFLNFIDKNVDRHKIHILFASFTCKPSCPSNESTIWEAKFYGDVPDPAEKLLILLPFIGKWQLPVFEAGLIKYRIVEELKLESENLKLDIRRNRAHIKNKIALKYVIGWLYPENMEHDLYDLLWLSGVYAPKVIPTLLLIVEKFQPSTQLAMLSFGLFDSRIPINTSDVDFHKSLAPLWRNDIEVIQLIVRHLVVLYQHPAVYKMELINLLKKVRLSMINSPAQLINVIKILNQGKSSHRPLTLSQVENEHLNVTLHPKHWYYLAEQGLLSIQSIKDKRREILEHILQFNEKEKRKTALENALTKTTPLGQLFQYKTVNKSLRALFFQQKNDPYIEEMWSLLNKMNSSNQWEQSRMALT